MRGWLILCFTFAIGIVLGVGAMTKGPALVAPYLPKSISGQNERIDGEVVRKQREGTRLLVKVATAQGPLLVTFTQKVAELDLLLEPGDRVELIASGYATFVEDPTLERVKRPAGTGGTSSSPSTSSGSQGSQEKTGR
jgi:TOBE domain